MESSPYLCIVSKYFQKRLEEKAPCGANHIPHGEIEEFIGDYCKVRLEHYNEIRKLGQGQDFSPAKATALLEKEAEMHQKAQDFGLLYIDIQTK